MLLPGFSNHTYSMVGPIHLRIPMCVTQPTPVVCAPFYSVPTVTWRTLGLPGVYSGVEGSSHAQKQVEGPGYIKKIGGNSRDTREIGEGSRRYLL